ncbi:MAG TPA: hypothetical protein V6D12_16325 [Candidatus Obscuribacterales bacterium]
MLIPRRTFLGKAWTITWVSAIGVLLPSSPVKAQTSTKPKHLEDALLLLEGLRWENNNYQHGEPTVNWKGFNGAADYVSKTDCSGFMSKLLQHSYGDYFTDERFKQWIREKKRKRPLAEDFHYAIVNQKDFIQIQEITQVKPGDIIAVKYLKKEDNDDNTENGKPSTGHVMLVAETPKQSSLIEGKRQWEVKVIDQSKSGHGKYDSRRKTDVSTDDSQRNGDRLTNNQQNNSCEPKKNFNDGLGKGTMAIYTNEDRNDILGYTWSICEKSKFYRPEERNLVVGRLSFN